MKSRAISGVGFTDDALGIDVLEFERCAWPDHPKFSRRSPSSGLQNDLLLKQLFASSPHESSPPPLPLSPSRLLRLPRTRRVRRLFSSCHSATDRPIRSAMGGDDGRPDGHLGTTWEVLVAVSLGGSSVYLCVFKP